MQVSTVHYIRGGEEGEEMVLCGRERKLERNGAVEEGRRKGWGGWGDLSGLSALKRSTMLL